ncbi:MAG: OB-fold nucleic acid binding domain-containing protein [Prevotella sp.]|nr:OB-fold nucleic acid binding domain-containing protein [Prevotella sp.]
MVKNLLYVMATAMLTFASAVQAQDDVVFDFDASGAELFGLPGESSQDSHDGDITADATATINGVSITVSAKEEGKTNDNRIWASSPKLRMYSGTLTVSATQTIRTITFEAHNTNFNLTTETGTLDGRTWTGEAQQVVFACSKNTQIKKITVSFQESTPGPDPDPEPYTFVGDGTEANPYTAADAIYLAVNNKYTADKVYIKGTVFNVATDDAGINRYHSINYYISDSGQETTPSFEIYQGLYFNGADFTTENKVLAGDEVVVLGTITYYANASQPETTKGAVLVRLVRNGEEIKPEVEPEPTGHGFELADPLSVEEAVDLTQELEAGAVSAHAYYIKGRVSQIDEVSTSFGNATYYISDDGTTAGQLEVYRGYYLDGEKFTAEDQLQLGDEVVVCGRLQNYQGTTPEVATGSRIAMINGQVSAITTVSATQQQGQAWNLSGQRVGADYRGLVVVGGRKQLRK